MRLIHIVWYGALLRVTWLLHIMCYYTWCVAVCVCVSLRVAVYVVCCSVCRVLQCLCVFRCVLQCMSCVAVCVVCCSVLYYKSCAITHESMIKFIMTQYAWVSHMNESCHTHIWISPTYEWAISHTYEYVSHINVSCHAHMKLSHTYESCHTRIKAY